MRISVLGTGYLGATHAAALARWGHVVVGVDVDRARVARLSRGDAPFHEPGFAALLQDGVRSGRLTFTTDVTAAGCADLHFLCVGTPQLEGGHAADLGALWSVVDALAAVLRPGALVVGKSTVPVGTAELVQQRLDEGATNRVAEVAWNPEFLREGHAVEDSLHPDRLVVGVTSDAAEARLREVYASLLDDGVPLIRTDLQTAELAKASANVMLASRVSVVNLLAEVCEAAGADIERLTEILGLDPRIGPQYLSPGLGFGGGCLPKDLRAFRARATELGVGTTAGLLLGAVDEVNTHQRRRAVDLALALLDGRPEGRRVAALGAAFKANSDDVRDSPALAVASALAAHGARVRVYDPEAGANIPDRPGLTVARSIESACRAADLTMVLTEWPEFADIDPESLGALVGRPVVLDGRLVLEPARWTRAGWSVHALGRFAEEAEPCTALDPAVDAAARAG